MKKPPKLPDVQQPTGQYREDVPSPTPFKRPSGEIRDMLKRIIVNQNKNLEERIENLEFIIWVVLATIFNIATILIILKW